MKVFRPPISLWKDDALEKVNNLAFVFFTIERPNFYIIYDGS